MTGGDVDRGGAPACPQARGGRRRLLLLALGLVLAPAPASAQGPRSEPRHALRVGGFFPLRDLSRGPVRASFSSALSFGLVLLPRSGPVSRVLVDAGPAVLRIDPDRRQCPLGFDCTPDTGYGVVATTAVEAGTRKALGRSLVAYATVGPALKLYYFRGDVACIPEDVACGGRSRYGVPNLGPGARASVGIQPPGAGRHLSAELGTTYTAYEHAHPQLDLAVSFAFRF